MIDLRHQLEGLQSAVEKIQSSPDDTTAIQRIDQTLAVLDGDERVLQSATGADSVSAQWAQQRLQTLQNLRAQMRQAREDSVAALKHAADERVRARAARAEAVALEALSRAQVAEARAREAESQAADAASQAQGAANSANRPRFCDRNGWRF